MSLLSNPLEGCTSSAADFDVRRSADRTQRAVDIGHPLFVVTNASQIHSGRPACNRARAWPRNVFGFVLASLLLHVGVLLAALHRPSPDAQIWRLYVAQGRNSVALEASVAATARPLPPTIVSLSQSLSDVPESNDAQVPPVSLAESQRRDDAELPSRPADKFTKELIETAQLVLKPNLSRAEKKSEVLEPLPRRAAPPKQTALAKLEPQPIVVDFNSVASAGATASSGVEEPAPPSSVIEYVPYPAELQRAGESGIVYMKVRVDRFGNVVQVELHESSGFSRLDQVALASMRQWKFTPEKPGVARASEFISHINYVPRARASAKQ